MSRALPTFDDEVESEFTLLCDEVERERERERDHTSASTPLDTAIEARERELDRVAAQIAADGAIASDETLPPTPAAAQAVPVFRASPLPSLVGGNADAGPPEAPHCGICLDALSTMSRSALPCGHCYHLMCISRWISRIPTYPTCPECRHPIDDGAGETAARLFGDSDDAVPKVRAAAFSLETRVERAPAAPGTRAAYVQAPERQSQPSVQAFSNLAALMRPGGTTVAPQAAPRTAPPSAEPGGRTYAVARPPAEVRAFLAGQQHERTLDPSIEHRLVDDDVGLDELRRDGVTCVDLAAFDLSWRDARRLGLRREHFESGWLDLARVHLTFRDVSWYDLEHDLSISLADVTDSAPAATSAASPLPSVTSPSPLTAFSRRLAPPASASASAPAPASLPRLSAHVLGRLGLDAHGMRECGLTRERFLALPFSQRDWIDQLRLSRADLVAWRVRPEDLRMLCERRGWSALVLEMELGYTVEELGRNGLGLNVVGLDALELRLR